MKLGSVATKTTLEAGQSRSLRLKVHVDSEPGNYIVTADVTSEGMEFREWVEALVTVK